MSTDSHEQTHRLHDGNSEPRWLPNVMTGPEIRKSAAALAVFGAIVACSDPNNFPSGPQRPASRVASAALQRARALRAETIDDRYEAIAQKVPGFGGAFHGLDGNTYVYVTDPAQHAASVQAISDMLPGSLRGKNVRLLRGQYDFANLRRWKRNAVELHNVPGVTFTDADEALNRVAIGVVDEAAAGRVRATLNALGIPDAAVVTRVRPRMQIASTLQDSFAVRRGALAVTGAPDWPNGAGYHCTIGFVVRMDTSDYGPAPLWDSTARYAITNSHCGGPQYMGQAKGKLFQYVSFAGQLIGDEVVDPAFYSQATNPWAGIWNCPTGRTCRMSDAAAYQFNNAGSAANGTMARTVGPPTYQTANSISIDGSTPTFTLSHYYHCYMWPPATCVTDNMYYDLAPGDTVYKIGSATGWTYGTITGTCMDEPMFDGGVDLLKTLFCQTEVSSRVSGGDSGSPVFVLLNGNVHAAGMLWGGAGSPPNQVYSFSAWAGIDLADLGLFRFAP